MKRLTPALAAVALSAALSGCIVAPPPPNGVVVPPGVVYVAPTYPAPAVGWRWAYHPQYGWGWNHPEHGWHRGWR
jgi:hypothetical protein